MRGLVITVLVIAAGLITAAPAAASCVLAPGTLKQRLDDAEIAFVGTVVRTQGSGVIATVNVESVWRGEVGPTTTVKGGNPPTQVGNVVGPVSSVDRSFEEGRRYLFVPFARRGKAYEDNACTDTQPWRAKLQRLAPAGATAISGPPDTTTDDLPAEPASSAGVSPGVWIGGTVLLALLALGAVVVIRRRAAAPVTE